MSATTPIIQMPTASTQANEDVIEQVAHRAQPAQNGHYDELRDQHGKVRPVWQQFFNDLGETGLQGLNECTETVNQLIEQNGITYNVYADMQLSRPWSLNVIPMLIGPKEWAHISSGLAQRARILNGVLQDVYGERALLKGNYLPSALVLGNPGYLHAMQGVKPLNGMYLHAVAFDVARGPDGQWWVVGQRTQSPSGLGYILENRLITSRMFPDTYRNMQVQHIGASYRRLLDSLESAASSIADGVPRFALLTPGPFNETYFEHAYLARYLGIPLVQGADLTVRDEKVYLKTLQGLQRIHGLLRRLDDDFCDPVELRADSALGTPGLLQAVRAGQVVMANALGTSFLESPAIQGFLPAISEHLLGSPLEMPSLNSWWCGEPAAWQNVSPMLHTQVIKPTFVPRTAAQHFDPAIGSLLNVDDLENWRQRINAQPSIYTTQAYLPFSQVPTWCNSEIIPRTAMLRFYAIAGADGAWQVMPGAMTRVASLDPHLVSMRSGGSTLDTWVTSEENVNTYSMLTNRIARPRWQAENELVSSRSAENLFWMGRYTERLENTIRVARESLVLLSTNQQDNQPALGEAMSDLASVMRLVPPQTPSISSMPLVFGDALVSQINTRGAYGIFDTVDALENAIRSVRDRLPPEHVEIPARIKSKLLQRTNTAQTHDVLNARRSVGTIQMLDDVEIYLAALVGYQSDRMTRDLGWHVLMIGRYVERLSTMSNILNTFFYREAAKTTRGFDALLVLFDSVITFRSRFQRQQDNAALLDLLIVDKTNPRAINCIVEQLNAELMHLPSHAQIPDKLNLIPTSAPDEQSLLTYALSMRHISDQISEQITRRFFVHAEERFFSS
jgi:uncharacterized circularly permuted ATP-grasp superfamily protein/uncharacterized alpha-E superfamily protein